MPTRVWGRLAAFLVSAAVTAASPAALAADATGTVKGRVTDDSGSPLPGASVTVTDVSGTTHSATTSASGEYSVGELEPGPYRVTAALIGFTRQSDHLVVLPGANAEASFSLRVLALEELVASASKQARKVREAPATVYVVTEAMIRERGYNYLYDALRDAPGLDVIWMNGLYGPILMPRGLDTQENNKLVLMVDGIVDNILSAGTAQVYMQYSLHNVKRVEIIYGPASALYGANAMAGLINIVTRTGEDTKGVKVQAGSVAWDPELRRTGSFFNAAVGKAWGAEGRRVDFAASVHVIDTDGPDLRLDADEARSDYTDSASGQPTTSPGATNYYFSPDYIGAAEAGTFMAQGRVRFERWGLTAGGHVWQHDGGQGTYGHEGFVFLNGLQNRPDVWNFRNGTAFLSHRKSFGELANNASLIFRSTTLTDGYDLYFDRTGTGPDGAGDSRTTGTSRYYRPDRTWKLDDHLQWEISPRMSLTVGVSAEAQYVSDYQLTVGHTFAAQNLIMEAPKPTVDDSRRYDYRDFSGYLEHVWQVSDRLSLTSGLRFDAFQLQGDRTPVFFGTRDTDASGACLPTRPACRTAAQAAAAGATEVSRVYYVFQEYDQTRTSVNPRLGAVFTAIPDKLTVKALYGEGFRMPTVRELFSVSGSRFANPDLDPEKIRTLELSGTYNLSGRGFVELDLFHTAAHDLIILTPGNVLRAGRTTFLNQFQNVAEPRIKGFDLKAQVSVSGKVDVFGHYSFQDPKYDEIDAGNHAHDPETASTTDFTDSIPRQARHKGTLGATVFLGANRRLTLTPRINWVGSRPGIITSTLQEVESYFSLNLSAVLRDVAVKGLSLSAVVYNMSNEDILDPGFRTGNKANDFPAAHPQPGVHAFLKLGYTRSF